MKPGKPLFLPALAGMLLCSVAHAVPVDATAIMKVGVPLTFTHTLTGISGLTDGVDIRALHLAEGTVSANKNMEMVRLAWDRVVNPAVPGGEGQISDFMALMKGPDQDIPVTLFYYNSADFQEESEMGGVNIYPDHPLTNFKYFISALPVPGNPSVITLKNGHYKLAVMADVVTS